MKKTFNIAELSNDFAKFWTFMQHEKKLLRPKVTVTIGIMGGGGRPYFTRPWARMRDLHILVVHWIRVINIWIW